MLLAENGLTGAGAATLAAEVCTPRQQPDGSWVHGGVLRKLDLWGNAVDCGGAAALADALLAGRQQPDGCWSFNGALEALDLRANKIKQAGAEAVADAMVPRVGTLRKPAVNQVLLKLDMRGRSQPPSALLHALPSPLVPNDSRVMND